ncbi:MAG: hypothetical protein QX196_01205 [Methylococcaceae bacterium]
MSNDNVISFSDYLKKKEIKIHIDEQYFDALSEDIKNRPELIAWFNFQNFFNKHKLFLHNLYSLNRQNRNPNSGYFVSFSAEEFILNKNKIVEANEWLERQTILIDAKNATFKEMAKQLYGTSPKNIMEAWNMFQDTLLKSNNVIVISNISQSKIPSGKSDYVRYLIKINDNARIKGVNSKSDILFIDSASFLERSWDSIGPYINVCI